MVLGVSLVGSISTMAATMYTPPDRSIQKHLFWLVCDNPFSQTRLQLDMTLLMPGFQCLPSSYLESFVLSESCHSVPCSTLHRRSRWIHILRRGNSHVCSSRLQCRQFLIFFQQWQISASWRPSACRCYRRRLELPCADGSAHGTP